VCRLREKEADPAPARKTNGAETPRLAGRTIEIVPALSTGAFY
jgi:hypothetical protein